MPETTKELILNHVDDLVLDFLYYDRKNDEDLPRGAIERALKDGRISIAEIVAKFEACLIEGTKDA